MIARDKFFRDLIADQSKPFISIGIAPVGTDGDKMVSLFGAAGEVERFLCRADLLVPIADVSDKALAAARKAIDGAAE